MWPNFDEWAELLLAASNIAPLLRRLIPLFHAFFKFEAPSDTVRSAAETAKEFETQFARTFEDENFLERVRALLRKDFPQLDLNLSVLISNLNATEKEALRKLIFAGAKSAGLRGSVFILANLASRGPELAPMRSRFDEMDLALRQAEQDPKANLQKLAELWRKLEPNISAKWHEVVLGFNLAMAELETQMRKPVPLKTLLFLDGFRWPSLPTTTRGKVILTIVAILILLDLVWLFTPQN